VEILGLVRVLWRRRLAVAIGAFLALAAAAGLGKSAPSSYGEGWTTVDLDTSQSQTVDTTPFGADSLPWRASLMIHLLSSDEAKRGLAQRLGIRVQDLSIIDPELATPELSASLPNAAAKAAAVQPAPYVLTVFRPNDQLALITMEGIAPTTRDAARLVSAAAASFEAQSQAGDPLTGVSTKEQDSDAFISDISKKQGFVVESAAPVRTKAVVSPGSYAKALLAAIVLFWLWCGCVAVLPRLARKLLPRRGRLQHARS
jgi:hypothetical protein